MTVASPPGWAWHNDMFLLLRWSRSHSAREQDMIEELMYETAAIARFAAMPGVPAPPTMEWAFDETCRTSTDGGSWIGFIAELDGRRDAGTLYLVDLKGPTDREFYLEHNSIPWWEIRVDHMKRR